jgi:hypothetical protein
MAAKKSLYQLLEVSAAASPEVIRAAHAARMARLAESATPEASAERAMLRDVLDILCDPERRSLYDARLREDMLRAMSSGMEAPRARPASARPPSGPGGAQAAGLSSWQKLAAAAALLAAASGGAWVWLDHNRKADALRIEAQRIEKETRLREEEAERRAEAERSRQEYAARSLERQDELRQSAEDRRRSREFGRARRDKLNEMQREEQVQSAEQRRKAAELQRADSQRRQQEYQDVSRQQQQLERERRQLRELEQNRGMKF